PCSLVPTLLSLSLSFYRSDAYRDLPSFPTRRSSDLDARILRHLPGQGVLTSAAADDQYVHVSILMVIVPTLSVETALDARCVSRSEEHTSELQSRENLVCRLLLEKKKKNTTSRTPPS